MVWWERRRESGLAGLPASRGKARHRGEIGGGWAAASSSAPPECFQQLLSRNASFLWLAITLFCVVQTMLGSELIMSQSLLTTVFLLHWNSNKIFCFYDHLLPCFLSVGKKLTYLWMLTDLGFMGRMLLNEWFGLLTGVSHLLGILTEGRR